MIARLDFEKKGPIFQDTIRMLLRIRNRRWNREGKCQDEQRPVKPRCLSALLEERRHVSMTEEGPSGDYRTTMHRDHHGRWIPINGERAMTTEKGKGGKTKLLRRGSTEQEAFSIAQPKRARCTGNFHLSRRNADELSWKQLSKEQEQEAETASASTDDGADPDAAKKKTIMAADWTT